MKYYLYLDQGDGGCDYTIDCAKTLKVVEADDEQHLMVFIKNMLEEDYNENYDSGLESLIYFSVEPKKVDIDKIYKEIKNEENNNELLKQKEEDLKEYNKLKEKLGYND